LVTYVKITKKAILGVIMTSFVIALRHQGILQSPKDRDLGDGTLAVPMRIGI